MRWPFADSPQTASFTSADVVDRGLPITLVTHDEDDGTWQFHSANGAPVLDADVRIVALKTILSLDSSIARLAQLPLGWMAARDGPGAPWKLSRQPD